MVATKTERIPIMFDKQLVERIDDYSYDNRIRTRSEAIRRLVLTSLETSANKKGEPSA
jgi:metal-responsive CopG/Arc/MetJ family transcriptional regulator